MDFKKNILTRVLAVICLVGFVIGWYLTDVHGVYYSFKGVDITFLFKFFATILGFLQVVISVIRWKKLLILDKVIFVVVILIGAFVDSSVSRFFIFWF